jgi:protein-arginine kinase activator protein McsA
MDKCPLSGLPCNHQKCIHVTEVSKNYTSKNTFDMCAVCGPSFIETNEPTVKQDIIPDKHVTPTDKLLESLPPLVSDVLKMIINNKIPQEVKACPNCGFTVYDITKTGRLGCGTCYEHFKYEMLPIIEAYHKSARHQGKGPKSVPLVEKPTLNNLEKELKAAIQKEDYEEAAKIRDLIKKLN